VVSLKFLSTLNPLKSYQIHKNEIWVINTQSEIAISQKNEDSSFVYSIPLGSILPVGGE
jgi:hypothetical protein